MRDMSITRPPRATPGAGSGVGVLDRVVAILDAVEAGEAAQPRGRRPRHRATRGRPRTACSKPWRRTISSTTAAPGATTWVRVSSAWPTAPSGSFRSAMSRIRSLARLSEVDGRERAALRPIARRARLRRRGRVSERAADDRRRGRRAPADEGLGRQAVPGVGGTGRPGPIDGRHRAVSARQARPADPHRPATRMDGKLRRAGGRASPRSAPRSSGRSTRSSR